MSKRSFIFPLVSVHHRILLLPFTFSFPFAQLLKESFMLYASTVTLPVHFPEQYNLGSSLIARLKLPQ